MSLSTTKKINNITLAEHVAMHMLKYPSGSLEHGGAIMRAGFQDAYGNGLDRGFGNSRYCDVSHGLDLDGDGTNVTYMQTECYGAHVWRIRHDHDGTPRGPFQVPEKYHHDGDFGQHDNMTDMESDAGHEQHDPQRRPMEPVTVPKKLLIV